MHSTETRTQSGYSGWQWLVIGLMIITGFLLAHPYRGIRHDGILYSAQAVYNAFPDHFRHDLFFMFGSQDDWTLYGKLYAKIIAAAGMRVGNMAALIVSQLLWWAGLWRVSKRLLPAPWHWIALLLTLSMPGDYGAQFTLYIDESFLSARLPAEALSLWAFSFALDAIFVSVPASGVVRPRSPAIMAALLLALLAMSLHPLIGAVGMAASVMILTPRLAWWRFFLMALPLFAATQWLTPASFAVHPLDTTWLIALRREVSFIFPTRWELLAWSKACWVLALPLILSASTQESHRRSWHLLALVGVSGMSFATLADLAHHDALWTQLQLWRVLWFLTALQWPVIGVIVLRERASRPALLAWLGLCWLLLETGGGGIFALAIAALLHVQRYLEGSKRFSRFTRLTGPLTPVYTIFFIIAGLGTGLIWFLFQGGYNVARIRTWDATPRFDIKAVELFVHTRLMLLVAGCLCGLFLAATRRTAVVLACALPLLLAYAIVNIDQRAVPMRIMEARLDQPARAPFARQVHAGQMVYWDGPAAEIVYPWLLMRTASYFSVQQSSGIVFHRATTFEALHRAAIVGSGQIPGRRPPEAPDASRLFRAQDFVPLSAPGIARVCAQPYVDFVVSSLNYPTLPVSGEWTADAQQHYWLYDCKNMNAQSLHPQPDAQSTQMPAGGHDGTA